MKLNLFVTRRLWISIVLLFLSGSLLAVEPSPPVDDPESIYTYKATVVKVVDADTVDLEVDLGFSVSIKERFRFHRINAWETRGAEKEKGLLAKTFAQEKLPEGEEITIKTVKDAKGKYGRYLVEIWLKKTGKWYNLNDELVKLGHARYQEY